MPIQLALKSSSDSSMELSSPSDKASSASARHCSVFVPTDMRTSSVRVGFAGSFSPDRPADGSPKRSWWHIDGDKGTFVSDENPVFDNRNCNSFASSGSSFSAETLSSSDVKFATAHPCEIRYTRGPQVPDDVVPDESSFAAPDTPGSRTAACAGMDSEEIAALTA